MTAPVAPTSIKEKLTSSIVDQGYPYGLESNEAALQSFADGLSIISARFEILRAKEGGDSEHLWGLAKFFSAIRDVVCENCDLEHDPAEIAKLAHSSTLSALIDAHKTYSKTPLADSLFRFIQESDQLSGKLLGKMVLSVKDHLKRDLEDEGMLRVLDSTFLYVPDEAKRESDVVMQEVITLAEMRLKLLAEEESKGVEKPVSALSEALKQMDTADVPGATAVRPIAPPSKLATAVAGRGIDGK